MIFYQKANAVHMGDIFFNLNSLPFVDVQGGGSLNGVISAVENTLSKIDTQTKVIPGHGPVTNKQGLADYLTLLNQAKSLMLEAMQGGKSADQVVQLKPLESLNLKYANWLPQERVTKLFYLSLKKSENKS